MKGVDSMLEYSTKVWNNIRAKYPDPKCSPNDDLVCSMDCLEYTKCYPEAFNKLVSATKDAVSSVKMMEAVMEMTDDMIDVTTFSDSAPVWIDKRTGQPYATSMTTGDTDCSDGWRKLLPEIQDWTKHKRTSVPSQSKTRCSYCNVRALPEDRFCEGCGASV